MNRDERQGVIAHDIRTMTVITALPGTGLLINDWVSRGAAHLHIVDPLDGVSTSRRAAWPTSWRPIRRFRHGSRASSRWGP